MSTTRRELLRATAGAVAWAACAPARSAPSGDALDEALHRIHGREPACVNGLSTHAPMVVETLEALGHPDRIARWLDSYRGSVLDLPSATKRIDPKDPKDWRRALGPDPTQSSWERANPRWRDWVNLFTAELAAAPWRDVLDIWAARLAPGMSGGATHGAIRASHAARGLARRDSPERRAELARGLAYWASSYEEIAPRSPRADRDSASPSSAAARPANNGAFDLDRVPTYYDVTGHVAEGRNIVEAVRHVRELSAFPAPPEGPASATDAATELTTLTARFAAVYLRHGTQHDTIAFLHAITGPASLRRLAPLVRPDTLRAALPYAWQAATAIYATYARRSDSAPRTSPKLTRDQLIERAIDSGDEHAIKLTETALVEHALHADPQYLSAAEHFVMR